MTFLAEFGILAPYLAATLVSSLVALVLLRGHQEVPGRVYFGAVMVSVALWSLLNFLEDAAVDGQLKLWLANAEYPLLAAVPVFFFRFASRHVFGEKVPWLESRWFRWGLWVIPLAASLAVWFDSNWGLMRTNLRLEVQGAFLVLAKERAPFFWVFVTYSYLLVTGAVALWTWEVWRRRPFRKGRRAALINLGAVLLPWMANIAQVAGLSPWVGHDLTTPAFSVMGLILLVSFNRNQFLSLVPAAQQSLMEDLSGPLLIFDGDGRLTYHNKRASTTWALDREDWGRPRAGLGAPMDWIPPPPPPGEVGRCNVVDGDSGTVWQVEERPVVVRGRQQGSVLTFHDVSALEALVSERTKALEAAYFRLSDELQHRRRTEQQLFYFSLHDSLTGLANRSLYLSRLGQALERVRREPTQGFGVALLNFVGFKKINDALGHGAGDAFLFQAALRLGKALRSVDTAARSAADTFLVLLDGTGSPERLLEAAERLKSELEAPLVLQGTTVLPSVKMGLVLGTGDHSSPEALLNDGEIALARTSVPGCPVLLFEEEWRQVARDREQLKEDLGLALIRGDLHLVYQPIVDLATGRLQGFEALTRWTHPERGLVPPNEFIPLAEKEGTIRPLGLWVLREAARCFVDLARRYPASEETYLSVNASPLQLAEPDFASILLGVLGREGLSPHRLHLEITETALVENSETLIPVLRTLRQQGIGIKLDDFGTGYSSLHALHRLPVDTLKIDRSFVLELPQGAPIIRTIVGLASELGLFVVAEGVELTGQRDSLSELGCGAGQGYLFSRGYQTEELATLFGKHSGVPIFLDETVSQP